MSTIRDVARQAGVSSATVSHVINGTRYVSDAVRQRVIAAMKELNYRPNAIARSLRSGNTNTIGLILPDSANPFFAELGREIEAAAFFSGYNVILCNSNGSVEQENSYINLLIEKQVDGIILDTEHEQIENLCSQIPDGLPVVMVDRDLNNNPFDIVLCDNHQGGYVAARHFIESGFNRIAIIKGPAHLLSSHHRFDGYAAALAESGLNVQDELVYHGDFRTASGFEAGSALLNQPHPPQAVFASNDMMAVGLIRAASVLTRRIPQDLAVIGFDDIEFGAYTYPSLSTIAQPKKEIAKRAVELLIDRFSNREKPCNRELIPAHLVIRDST